VNMIPDGQHNQNETDYLSTCKDSLVSILLYNYEGRELYPCLHSIFDQHHINNFEVVLCDDASTDGAWQIATRFVRDHAEKVTISRNNISIGKDANRRKGLRLCKGEYCVELTSTAEFNPVYTALFINSLETDEIIENSQINRLTLYKLKRANVFLPLYSPVKILPEHERVHHPLVSVCIFNFNYGRYLCQCLDSVFAQTYDNIEICFSDNASTDNSWEIALEYADKYPGKISLTRNRMNFGPSVNRYNCFLNQRGKYMLPLCSDDAMRPEFVERCVTALESHPDAAFAMVHRDIMDGDGQCSSEPPFYDKSCLIPGAEQAAVYMMSSVNPSVSQILYNIEKAQGMRSTGDVNDRWFGDRIADFHMCCYFPIVYIKEPLLLNRLHRHNDGARMDGNLLQCMTEYVLLHQLADMAENHKHMQKVRDRLQTGIEKLGHLCLRYCLRRLTVGDELSANRYFHLATAIFPGIRSDCTYTEFAGYWSSSPSDREKILEQLMKKANLEKRTISYSPPPGSIPLHESDQ
jgi:glycosyltransferase involved in cell wall biosynthesis